MEFPSPATEQTADRMRFAIRLSLAFGVLMLVGKVTAYWLTGSAAILSDAAESVIHVVAVGFAAFSLRLSLKPADVRFPFGYERITFFSAGFEGALIILAAITIIAAAVEKWRRGLPLQQLGEGTLIVLAAAVLNAALGLYLVRVGRRTHSLILEANGRHVLTDSWTSFGVVAGLALVIFTGWKPLDPICAIAVAVNILWSGGRLVWRSVGGLLDYSDPETGRKIRSGLDHLCARLSIKYHGMRFRDTGQRLIIQVHLLFPHELTLGDAHELATKVEDQLSSLLDRPAEVVTHLESSEDHGEVHPREHFTGEPER